jgi:hypothetical protein
MADVSPLPQVVIKDEPWVTRYWRPMMAWQYFAVCLFDFIIFPCIAMYVAKETGHDFHWDPLTLKDSGFYHITMGVVIGVSAWTRGQENLERTRVFGQAILQNNYSTPPSGEGVETEGQNPPQAPSKQGG